MKRFARFFLITRIFHPYRQKSLSRLVRWEGNKLPQGPDQVLAHRRDQLLFALLATVVLLFFVWSAFAPIDRIVRAQGRFIASGRAQVVQHLEGGIVSEILVREGQMVTAGQAVMRLSDVHANSNVKQGQSRLQAQRAAHARLSAEAQGLSKLVFGPGIEDPLKALEQKAFEERSVRLNSEQMVLRQQIAQRQSELNESRSRSQSLNNELALAHQQASLLSGLLRKGAASQMETLEAQGRSERLKTQYLDTVNAIPRLQSAVSETTARLSESVARFRAEARTELNQVSAEIARIEAGVNEDSDRLDRTEVRAPTKGYVNRLYVNTLGGVIKPGEPVLEITPSEGPLTVEARVRPDDRASLRAGLTTRVMVGAYDYTVYGALQGRVTEVSADTVPDENGQRYYRVLVNTDPAQGKLTQEIILPGMTASADVVVGQRSVLSYLLSPLLRFTSQAFREPR